MQAILEEKGGGRSAFLIHHGTVHIDKGRLFFLCQEIPCTEIKRRIKTALRRIYIYLFHF